MKLGIAIKDTWSFFTEIYEDLKQRHETSLFKPRQIKAPVISRRVNDFLFRRDLQTFLRTNDVVFFEWGSDFLAAASQLPRTCGIVTRIHRYELYTWADRINWDVVDKVILVSRAKQREFNARFPAHAAKTEVIYEAVSLDQFHPGPRKFGADIGTLCHLVPRKRVYELILAFSELSRHEPGARLHIGGGPKPKFRDYYAALHSLVRELGIQDKVVFYGNVADPAAWYRNIDIFVSNSYSEGLQVASIEAMASGCMVFSHRWEGADELLPDDCLYYTDSELVQRIRDYCASAEPERQRRRDILQLAARQRFSVDVTKAQIRRVIDEVGAGLGGSVRPQSALAQHAG